MSKRGRKFKDLSGQKIGDLTVLRLDDRVKYKRWICKCNCGTVVSLTPAQISRGHCGCLNKGRKPLISKDELYNLYVVKGYAKVKIEQITGISRRTISKYINMYDLDNEKFLYRYKI